MHLSDKEVLPRGDGGCLLRARYSAAAGFSARLHSVCGILQMLWIDQDNDRRLLDHHIVEGSTRQVDDPSALIANIGM